MNNGGCSHNCTVAPGEGIVCSCPLGMELGADNKTCQIQSYCAKHLKCSQKCEQDKYNVKCSCYEGWMLEPDGESCRSLGGCWWDQGEAGCRGSQPRPPHPCSRGAGPGGSAQLWLCAQGILSREFMCALAGLVRAALTQELGG